MSLQPHEATRTLLNPAYPESTDSHFPLADLLNYAEQAQNYAAQGDITPEGRQVHNEIIGAAADSIFNRLNVSDIRYYSDDPEGASYQEQRLDHALRVAFHAREAGYDPVANRNELTKATAKLLKGYLDYTDPLKRLRAVQDGTFDADEERARLALVKASVRELSGLDRDANVTALELEHAQAETDIPFAIRDGGTRGRPRVRDESYFYQSAGSRDVVHEPTASNLPRHSRTLTDSLSGITLRKMVAVTGAAEHYPTEVPHQR
jgi:hypothetical protein